MKSAILAGAITLAFGTVSLANGLLLGGRQSRDQQMRHRHQQPGIYFWGDIWFGDGPYRSLADAKLARSTIGVCPEKDPSK